jgi:DNA-binding response OmpR family regulator
MRILIVEDEPKVATALRQGLEAETYFISVANNGEEGFPVAAFPADSLWSRCGTPARAWTCRTGRLFSGKAGS